MNAVFASFPSIESYRDAIKEVQHVARYRGKDEHGKPTYDMTAPLPKVTLRGTVKLHGSNCGLGFSDADGVWSQSRNLVLTAAKPDAFGFRNFVNERDDLFRTLCGSVPHEPHERVYVFGEWCGKGVQRGAAICLTNKKFFIFAACTTNKDSRNWLPEAVVQTLKAPEHDVYNVYDFTTWTLQVDFGTPQDSQAILERITADVERQCPIAAQFGAFGVGEGIGGRAL